MEDFEEKWGMTPYTFGRIARILSFVHDTLGVHESFLMELPKDDWSFIIKLHAIVEATLNHMLGKHFANPALDGIIAKLDTSNQNTGKAAFIKAFELLPKSDITFIQRLSGLRNTCVHNAANFAFNLKAYVLTFNEDQRRSWVEQLTFGARTLPKSKIVTPTEEDEALSDPRTGLYLACMAIVQRGLLHDVKTGETIPITLPWEEAFEHDQSSPNKE